MTDAYPWSEHPDSLAIEDKHLGDIVYEYDNYHLLSEEYRTRFLKRMGITEEDQIFVYSIPLDSIESFLVKDIPLIAMLSPYGPQGPARQYDYMIGFELLDGQLKGGYYNSLVYVGESNPFVQGELTPIYWEEIKINKFPADDMSSEDSIAYHRYQPSEPVNCYFFKYKEFEYYVRNIGKGKGISTRHVRAVNAKKNEVTFNGIYHDSEGTYLLSLNGVENVLYGSKKNQWTGRLFKEKPPVILGFLGVSFGCPRIDFLDDEMAPIYIRCDNRH